MKNILKIRLQLFAEGAPTGEAGAEAAAVTGNETAEDTEVAAQETAENESQLATDTDVRDFDTEFSELIKGEYKDSFEKVLKSHLGHRLKGAKAKEAELEAVKPIVDMLKARHGIEDLTELANAVEEDALYIQKRSMDTGESRESILNDIRSKRQQREVEKDRAKEHEELESMRAEKAHRQRLEGWMSEANALKDKYPELDLKTELRNRGFFNSLMKGFSVEEAYIVSHHSDLVEQAKTATAAEVKKATLDNIAAGANRPSENGSTSSQASARTDVDVNSLTGKDVLDILKQVERGATIKF